MVIYLPNCIMHLFGLNLVKLLVWRPVGKPTESYSYDSWRLTHADKAIEEDWQMHCEEELAKDSNEGEDKPPQA